MKHYTGIYRWTFLGRPLDWSYPTNRAVLILMPVAGLAAAVNTPRFYAFLAGAGAALGAWALARELVPDHPLEAFVPLFLQIPALVPIPEASILLLFATMLLVRMVNRTVGLPARLPDSLAVSTMAAYAMYATQLPWIGLAAAAAFLLDASLAPRLKRQWIFALLWLLIGGAWLARIGTPGVDPDAPASVTAWVLIAASLLFVSRIARTRPPDVPPPF